MPLLTDSAIDALTAAVYEKPSPWVAETYSNFDAEPLQFSSSSELRTYVHKALSEPRGHVSLCVVYPEMAGRAVRETIHLKPGSVPGHVLRYTWRGWGLISVHLMRECQSGIFSYAAANSLARAEKWALTYPDWEPPSTWNWKEVASHTRRLKRVLKKSM